MKIPFTADQFFDSMAAYNVSMFPVQIVLALLAVGLVAMVLLKARHSGVAVLSLLGVMWVWMGTVYQWLFFAPINPAAYAFGGLFVAQGLLLFFLAYKRTHAFAFRADARGIVGLLLVVFALLIYPAFGFFSGHRYPSAPTFGLPCPTTIFTFGMLLMATKRLPWYVFVVPVLWSVVGFNASWLFGVYEDIALPLSALVTVVLMLTKLAKAKTSTMVAAAR